MNRLNRFQLLYLLALAPGLALFTGCVPMEPTVRRPTLYEARLGQAPQQDDMTLRAGEIRGEVVEIDPARREIHVRTDDARTRVLSYDPDTAKVFYHGSEYAVANLESGDLIAFQTRPWNSRYVATIRVQEPVQARAGSTIARRPPPPRAAVIEGTVERIDLDLGVFDLRPRDGRIVTVSLPYNARGSDVDSFRRLRRGDYVRLEGEFVNPDSFQLLAFLAESDRTGRIR